MTSVKFALAALFATYLVGCSGSDGDGRLAVPPAPNVIDVVVDPGPEGIGYTNGIFASVKLCQPGTSICQVIDHLLVDTGSVGVRVLETLVELPLADVVSNGQTVAECAPFVDGSTWGPLKTADVVLGGETAASQSIQLIGVSRFSKPADCTGKAITNLQELGTNGILGVGIFIEDCGPACASSGSLNPGYYHACAGPATCNPAAVALDQQLANPVAALPVNNNGVMIQLPRVADTGAPRVPGVMVLGIGTQANNDLGSATLLALDKYGEVSTTYPVGGTAYTSIIDSGSNGLFFLDAATTGLPMCTGGLRDFYCPPATESLSASILSASGAEIHVAFSVANASKLRSSSFAFSNLAGAMPGFPGDASIPAFDWGLPFFFGRTVYTAIENRSTPAGPGPFLAF